MFSFEGWRLLCSLGILYKGLGIDNLQFLIKKILNFFQLLIFLNFWSSKPWIRIGIQPKMLNTDPKHCRKNDEKYPTSPSACRLLWNILGQSRFYLHRVRRSNTGRKADFFITNLSIKAKRYPKWKHNFMKKSPFRNLSFLIQKLNKLNTVHTVPYLPLNYNILGTIWYLINFLFSFSTSGTTLF